MTRSQSSGTAYEPIAIIGIGCRFPGGIVSPESFWDFLMRGGDGTREVPEDRWSLTRHYDKERGRPGKIYTRRGGFIDGVKGFDPQFFGISPREAAYMDPQQRLLLEATWEAFEDAGIVPAGLGRHKVGVFVGLFTHDYENIHMRTTERGLHSSHSATGMSTTIAANRLSYAFDFMGPSLVVDTACSSSLVATHLACRALQSGEAEIAIAGGVNLQLSPDMTMALSNATMLAPDGRSKSFDARANGYARADGVGVVVLKPLVRAERDGDAVYAVIAGSAVNQDGHSPGITVPNGAAQKIVMGDALAAAGLAGTQISYVEAHGTGTPVGDPIEAGALGAVLSADDPRRLPCVIGSVKSNFGHAESAAGVAGLIKVALMQHKGRIPANLHFETPNPNIDFETLRLRVPTKAEDWPAGPDGQRFAGVNSFGFGGTNAHVVVARAPERASPQPAGRDRRATHLLPLSARSKDALTAGARRLADFLVAPASAGLDLDEVSAALALGRSPHEERLFIAAQSREAAVNLLAGFAAGDRQQGVVAGTVAVPGKLAFVCSGMGQQWWGMGRGLVAAEPVFAEKIAEIDALFARLSDDHRLADLFAMDEAHSPIDKTQYAQTAIFAVQVGLAALWESVGIRPDFVVGHSVGEVAASHISGALSLQDAVTVSYHRSRLQARLAGRGSMLAVGLSEASVRPYLKGIEDIVSFGAVNSPSSVTLAGDTAALKRLCARFEAEEIFARLLNVELPYHSPVMDEIGPEFRAALGAIAPRATTLPLVSTVTGTPIEGTALNADYWVTNIRAPVRFSKAIASLVKQGCTSFVELGAHPVLGTSINECLAAAGVSGAAIASQRRKQDDSIAFWSAFGQLFCRGLDIAFPRLFRRTGRRVGLPLYAWQNAEYWMESTESQRDRTGRSSKNAPDTHPLLGDRRSAPHPAWRAEIGPERPVFLKDHCVEGSVVFPAAGYIELALAAARQEAGADSLLVLEDIRIESALVLAEAHPTQVEVSLGEGGRFDIHSLTGKPDEQHWRRHVTGTWVPVSGRPAPAEIDWAAIEARLGASEDAETFYSRFAPTGLGYGPRFRSIDTAWIGSDEVLGHFSAAAAPDAELSAYLIHPAVLDSTFQLLAGLPEDGTYLPAGVERVSLYRPGETIAWAHMRLVSRSRSRLCADIAVANQDGAIIATIEGLTCELLDTVDRNERAAGQDYLYLDTWVEEPLAGVAPAPRLGDFGDMAGLLQARHAERQRDGAGERFVAEALPALDMLALDYFCEALVGLGWCWEPGKTFGLEAVTDGLGIVARHHRFVARLLSLLAASGRLAAEPRGWRVIAAPAPGTAAERWRQLVGDYPDCHAELVLIGRCGKGLKSFLTGADEPLFALFPKDCPVAEHLYTDAPTFDPYNRVVADYVGELVTRLPATGKLRVLEAGAGTGGLSAFVLPLLPPERTEYVYTDLSERFLGQARQRFRQHGFVSYQKLDIESDPAAQGFTAESFDLVLGSDVLHATADLGRSLAHVRSLLKPDGTLALIEATGTPVWFDLVFGLLPGWWAFTDTDLRPDHATLPVAGWLDLIACCGFEAAGAVIDAVGDHVGPQSVLLARKPDVSGAELLWRRREPALAVNAKPRPVVVLGDGGLAAPLCARLAAFGAPVASLASGAGLGAALAGLRETDGSAVDAHHPVVVDLRALARPAPGAGDRLPSDRAVRMCVDLQGTVVALAAQAHGGRPALFVVTRGAAAVADDRPDPAGAAVRGFARTAMNEHGEIDTRLIDLGTGSAEDEIAGLVAEILGDGREPEIALRGPHRFVSRVHRWRALRSTEEPGFAYELRPTGRPAPDDLAFHQAFAVPPGPGEVQLRLDATGVNFKDYALLSGLVAADAGEIGMEAAGTVLAAGAGVGAFAPGDKVFGFVRNGMNAVVNVPAALLAAKPDNLSFADAAGIPVVFFSAYHALKRLGGLRDGEKVLIHTGASGLGLAAIAVAQALGATVLATAGTPEKRAYLEALGLCWVGDSRSADFARAVKQLTGGVGVDLVLNTLNAELNAHNFDILTPGTGRLVDVANVHYDAKIAFATFARGLTVAGFDLDILARENPAYVGGVLSELAGLFASGTLRPVPYRAIALDRLSEVLQSVRRATHTGKLVVSHRHTLLPVRPETRRIALEGAASYLVTGGLSGFGLATARWLAECGARHLVLVGRRGAATPEAAPVLADLAAMGVGVEALACDVASRDELAVLIARFGRDLPPLRGIVHGAMVLKDSPLRTMTPEDIRAVLVPKIDGAANLDALTQGQKLDFFICASSVSGLMGNRDQANYAAANAAIEALMAGRRARGLPGLAIGWGAIGEIGRVAHDSAILEVFQRQGIYPLPLHKAWTTLALGLGEGRAYLGAIAADWRKLGKFARVVAATPRFRFLVSGISASGAADEVSVMEEGGAATTGGIEQAVVRDIAAVLGMKPDAIDINKPLPELGFDSLLAVELSVALEHSTGHGFNRMSLLRPDLTAAELIAIIEEERPGASTSATPAASVASGPDGAVDVSELSDAEVDALLRQLSAGE